LFIEKGMKLKLRKFEKGYHPTILMRIMLLLCIIAFSISALFNGFIGIFNHISQELIQNPNLPSYLHFYRAAILDTISISRIYFILIALLNTFLVISLIIMFRGFTTGYYSFFISQIFLLIIPLLFIGIKAISLGDLMIAFFLIVFFFIEILIYQVKTKKED
jgi:hypothetical protein